MPHVEPDRIRNVALVGHRASGKSVPERGAAVRGGGRSTGWARWRTAPRSPTPRRTSRRAACRSRPAWASVLLWRRAQGHPDRHAGRAQLRGRRAGRAARVRKRCVRDQRGRRASRWAPSGCGSGAQELGNFRRWLLYVNMLDRERADFFRSAGVVEGGVRPPRGGHRDPDRGSARSGGPDRPD